MFKFTNPILRAGQKYENNLDQRTFTIPNAVPSLAELVASGMTYQVGKPMYDKDEREGQMRLMVQERATFEDIMNLRYEAFSTSEQRKPPLGAVAASDDTDKRQTDNE